jgi:hypothetical protein
MQRFGPRTWILAAGLVAVTVINGVLALVLSRAVSEAVLAREAHVARDYLGSIVRADGLAASLFAEPRPSPALQHFATYVEALPGVVRVNVYAPDSFIRHSTEPNMIGLKFEGNAELAAAFAGQISAKLETIAFEDKPEHLALNRFAGKPFIEAYLPVPDGDGKIIAVVELYQQADAVLAVTGRLQRIIILSELLGGMLLLIALYALFRRKTPR